MAKDSIKNGGGEGAGDDTGDGGMDGSRDGAGMVLGLRIGLGMGQRMELRLQLDMGLRLAPSGSSPNPMPSPLSNLSPIPRSCDMHISYMASPISRPNTVLSSEKIKKMVLDPVVISVTYFSFETNSPPKLGTP